jgi:hypothetical protein
LKDRDSWKTDVNILQWGRRKMIDLLGAISWPHTIPLMVVILALVFRKQINAKIEEISALSGEGKKLELAFRAQQERPDKALPEGGAQVITEADVETILGKIPDLNPEGIARYRRACHAHLLRNGVITVDQLESLVSSEEVLTKLREIYIEELKRNREAPLDPVAVTTWGATLFVYGVTPEVERAVRQGIRRSPEYKQKHGLR